MKVAAAILWITAAISTEQLHDQLRPAGLRIEHRGSGQNQRHDGDRKEKVGEPPKGGPALDIFPFALRQFVDLHVRPVLGFLAVLVLPVEPQRGVQPEEGEDTGEQRDHELGGEPHMGIAFEIVGIAVRLERGEALDRVLMTFPTGGKAVRPVHLRCRVVHPLDFVVSVAVEALGRIGITQGAHLAVVGTGIGLQLLVVAVPAICGNRQFDRIALRRFDVMGGMAVYADGRERIAVEENLLAVHRGQIVGLFLGVTPSAHLWNIHS
jgi:hypothetical protein